MAGAFSTGWLTFAARRAQDGPMSDALSLTFAALADPTRRAILAMLLEDDMAVTDVAEPFAMSLAAISKHLRVLAEAGLIAQERRGRVTWCKLDPDAMRAASVWMQGFGQFDPVDLDGLERFLLRELDEGARGVDGAELTD
jgi:DNA-binding transcriptional ArsR family regulator